MKYRWCNKQNVNPTDKQHTFPYEFNVRSSNTGT